MEIWLFWFQWWFPFSALLTTSTGTGTLTRRKQSVVVKIPAVVIFQSDQNSYTGICT